MQRPTFLARCGECGDSFSRPEQSDFAYGQRLFSTSDGHRHAEVNGLDEFPCRVDWFVADNDFWHVLARLADPIDGQTLVVDRPCPNCGSTNLESWSGNQSGICEVETVTFERATLLNDVDLIAEINGN
ncbi:MAG: hypothetical protein P1V19_25160 [Gimesia sp.]|nr:hypothetical protein [Gimesia sp.]